MPTVFNEIRAFLPAGISLEGVLFAALLLSLIACLLLALRNRRLEGEKSAHQKIRHQLGNEITELRIEQARLRESLAWEKRNAAEKLRLLEQARDELKLQFEALAARIFDEKTTQFNTLSRQSLSGVLEPFQKELASLKKEMGEIYLSETRERASLKTEIGQLRDLNQRLNLEAVNLTKALKGDSKARGNWGELVLERVLEVSGLRRGYEYEVQTGYRDQDQKLFKPDLILRIPGGKDLIVDSKMSLTAWQRVVNSESSSERDGHLRDHCRAIEEHLRSLSDKNYQDLKGLNSLDFVLMFVPVEAAFAAAVEKDPGLLKRALDKNIAIVTPTTLLATLRTVENVWKYERQNKNAAEIARRAGSLYDKFRGFVEELEKIGRQLSLLGNAYEAALTRLCRGQGNLVSQAEQLKELGARVKKELPKSITDASELDFSGKNE